MIISPGYVGIDISKRTLDVFDAAMGRAERIENASAPLAALTERWRGKDVFVVFEATGRYDQMLQAALHGAGIVFARVNPGRARDFARAAGFLAKTDKVDAKMLAMMAERLKPRAELAQSSERERLRMLHRRRDQLVHARKQERTRLSEAAGEEELADLAAHIDFLSGRIADFDRRIRQLIAMVQSLKLAAATLRQAPGIGPVAATTLLALLPELGSRSPKAIAALAGLAPLNRDSGTVRGKRTIAGGRKRVRNAVYMASLAAIRTDPHFKAIYDRLVAAGKAKKLAIIAVARKLLIALNAMIRDRTGFNPV